MDQHRASHFIWAKQECWNIPLSFSRQLALNETLGICRKMEARVYKVPTTNTKHVNQRDYSKTQRWAGSENINDMNAHVMHLVNGTHVNLVTVLVPLKIDLFEYLSSLCDEMTSTWSVDYSELVISWLFCQYIRFEFINGVAFLFQTLSGRVYRTNKWINLHDRFFIRNYYIMDLWLLAWLEHYKSFISLKIHEGSSLFCQLVCLGFWYICWKR